MTGVSLEARGIGWKVRAARIVEDVSLHIRPGEMVGVIGPNGSGKSTLLRLLAGVLAPAGGEIFIDGRPMLRLGRRQVARRLALVAQRADTPDAIGVREAVELGRTPWLSALQTWSRADDDAVRAALAAVGMSGKADRLWRTLSGGEQQRVHIARALAQQPGILLLDEPTNHLDIQQQLALMQLIRDLPLTKVLAIHDLNQALECDRLLVMHEGRLVCDGTPAQVLQPPLLAQVFRVRASAWVDPFDGARVLRFAPLRPQSDASSEEKEFPRKK